MMERAAISPETESSKMRVARKVYRYRAPELVRLDPTPPPPSPPPEDDVGTTDGEDTTELALGSTGSDDVMSRGIVPAVD